MEKTGPSFVTVHRWALQFKSGVQVSKRCQQHQKSSSKSWYGNERSASKSVKTIGWNWWECSKQDGFKCSKVYGKQFFGVTKEFCWWTFLGEVKQLILNNTVTFWISGVWKKTYLQLKKYHFSFGHMYRKVRNLKYELLEYPPYSPDLTHSWQLSVSKHEKIPAWKAFYSKWRSHNCCRDMQGIFFK